MSNKNKLWYKVELLVAKALGLKRIGFSGGVWPKKEDLESDFDFIAQAKATEGKAVSIKVDDINALTNRALIQDKIPLFVFHLEKAKYQIGKTWIALPLDEFENIKRRYYDEKS